MRFLLACLLFYTYVPLAQAQQHAVSDFSVDDGLPSSHVYEVKQDKHGFYWIATSEGVVKYDGYAFYSLRKYGKAFDRDIWWTHEDSQNRVWGLGKGFPLWYLKTDSFHSVAVQTSGIPDNLYFSRIYEDEFGMLWLSSGGSVFTLKENDIRPFHYQNDLSDKGPPSYPNLWQRSNGQVYFLSKTPLTVWKTTENGGLEPVFRYSTNVFLRGHCVPDEIQANDENTTVIIQSYDSIYTIRNDSLRIHVNGVQKDLGLFPAKDKLKFRSYKVTRLRDKFVFLHSDGNFLTDLNFQYLKEFDFVEKLNINTAYQDHEGSIWFSTPDQGLLYLSEDALAVKTHTVENEKESSIVSIVSDTCNSVWVAYKNCTVCNFKNAELQTCFKVKPNAIGNLEGQLREMTISHGILSALVGYYEIQAFELDKLRKGVVEPIVLHGLENTKSMNLAPDGNVYITDYISCFRLNVNGRKPSLEQIHSNTAVGMVSSTSGNHIISSFDGLYSVSSTGDSVLLDGTVETKHFEVGPRNSLWAIDRSRGLVEIADSGISHLELLNDLIIRDVHFDEDSVLWVATNQGLLSLTNSKGQYSKPEKLTTANGLVSNDISAVFADADHIYVGTSKGLNIINRNALPKSTKGHRIFITSLLSRGKSIQLTDNLVLEPDNNAIEFQYVYISPKSTGQITYEYMLEGIDEEWQSTKETRIHYPFLPSGDYKFHLRAKDINGVPSSDNINLTITVEQYWYKTIWFIVLAIVGSIAAITGFLVVRFNRLRERERERTEMNNRIAELRLNALQSQMNPHFVFNVLNSIQDCFVSNNVLEANRYMTDFSKLMRLFLESSDDKVISLTKEIKLLSYYIELERMRLDRKFEFDFQVEDDLDPDEYRIPTMILQPIVENAILHGLRYKDGDGKLTISFQLLEDETLLIGIEDNGVGRKKAAEINTARRKDHVSKAANIIEERINIINSSSTDNIELNYIDLEDESGALGTRVELKMNLGINR